MGERFGRGIADSVVSRLKVCQPLWGWLSRWRYAVRCIGREADDHIKSLEARIRELEANQNRWPRTADGVPLSELTSLYHPSDPAFWIDNWGYDSTVGWTVWMFYRDADGEDKHVGPYRPEDCYSTPEAAQAAADRKERGDD